MIDISEKTNEENDRFVQNTIVIVSFMLGGTVGTTVSGIFDLTCRYSKNNFTSPVLRAPDKKKNVTIKKIFHE